MEGARRSADSTPLTNDPTQADKAASTAAAVWRGDEVACVFPAWQHGVAGCGGNLQRSVSGSLLPCAFLLSSSEVWLESNTSTGVGFKGARSLSFFECPNGHRSSDAAQKGHLSNIRSKLCEEVLLTY